MASKDDLVGEVGATLFQSISSTSAKWSHAVIVARLRPGQRQMNGLVFGDREQYKMFAPRNADVLDLLGQLREAMASDDKRSPWVTCLIRLVRESKDCQIDFEYDNIDRWSITPANVEERAKQFKSHAES